MARAPEETAPAAAPELEQPAQTWRAPVVLQVKSVVSAALGILVVAVFFPVWIAIPVAVVLGGWGVGMCVRRAQLRLDPGAGTLTVRRGPLTRRVAVRDIDVVGLDRAKVTIGRADGTAISCYAWRRSRLDQWLRVPVVASDVAHAISKAAAAVRGSRDEGAGGARRTRSGKNSSLTVVAVTGIIEIAAAFFVRVSWGSPALTVLGVIVALGLGFTGMFSVVFALWTFLSVRTRRR
ncbi:MAG TPA: hypothetical protein VG164_12175 [Trebonia sp.]|jgi:hypothetical protein|nr:hypothetical protein [Trebonia sp.]